MPILDIPEALILIRNATTAVSGLSTILVLSTHYYLMIIVFYILSALPEMVLLTFICFLIIITYSIIPGIYGLEESKAFRQFRRILALVSVVYGVEKQRHITTYGTLTGMDLF